MRGLNIMWWSILDLIIGINLGYFIHQKAVIRKAKANRNMKIHGHWYKVIARKDLDVL
ncbi:hypothetical protein J31TS6_62430 [Brevibacillus reuszeri]|nr:hypothetical protein J31TS6_62430 [Brevibacillus reuszeri]